MTVNNIATPEGQVSRSCEEGPMAGDSLVFFDETTDIEALVAEAKRQMRRLSPNDVE